MRALLSLFAGLMTTLASSFVLADSLDIREWQVPYEHSVPRDPFAVSATSIWFVGQRGGYLANLDTDTGQFMRVPLKGGSGPHNLIVGSYGSAPTQIILAEQSSSLTDHSKRIGY